MSFQTTSLDKNKRNLRCLKKRLRLIVSKIMIKMKQLSYFLLPLVLLIFACNSNENSETTTDTSSQVLTEFVHLTFEGALKAKKDIPVAMTLNKTGQSISGEMLYKKVGKPIDLIGNIDDAGTISLQETVDGEITGYYEGQIVDRIFTGLWKSADEKTSFDFSMNISDKDFNTFVKKDLDILKYTGLYEIKPKEGQDADYHYTFEIEQTGEDNIKFLFFGTRGKPSYNMGSLEGNAILKDKIATFNNDDMETCEFQLVFTDNGLTASYLNEKDDCLFGFRVYLQGNYVKTNSDKPVFKNKMR